MEGRRLRQILFSSAVLLLTVTAVSAQDAAKKVRITYPEATECCFPILAAQEWGIFAQNGLRAEIVLMQSRLANTALVSGDVDYVAGVGPNSVSGTLRGMASRAVWFASTQLGFVLLAKPEYRQVSELRGKKIGLPSLGGTTDVALTIALQELGEKRKDFTYLALGGDLFTGLASGAVDAAVLSPPWIFYAEKKGFRKLVQIGNYVQMPLGGLTTMQSTIRNRPDEAKRVVRSLQLAQKSMIEAPEKGIELISQSLKVDRAIAEETFKLYRETTATNTGIPTRAGMGRIVEAIQMLGQFTDRKVAFEEIADDGIAKEVARELGYKVP
jgi:NitT/TauT family transport system substrate-binding protein